MIGSSVKLAIVVGTRPEIIKMSPIIKECVRRGLDYSTIHTGQHYSFEMDRIFFEQIRLPEPDYKLRVGSGSHAHQTAKIMTSMEEVVSELKPDFVLVEGDTNTVFASAVATTKLHIKVGHVEAGLRSQDKSMPEEVNRILTDHCSDILFAPTDYNQRTLQNEGISPETIFVTGNTIVDALYQHLEILKFESSICDNFGLEKNSYIIVTLHRSENVDDPVILKAIVEALDSLSQRFNYPLIFPIHPRTEKMLNLFNIQCKNVRFLSPLDYFSFLQLEKNAKLILTDSGGVQEEACIMNVPCVTLRNTTERIETLEIGANILATTPNKISRCVEIMLEKERTWTNPYGDGRAGNKIMDILENLNNKVERSIII